jgi:hypothetical protein
MHDSLLARSFSAETIASCRGFAAAVCTMAAITVHAIPDVWEEPVIPGAVELWNASSSAHALVRAGVTVP